MGQTVEVLTKSGQRLTFTNVTACDLTEAPERAVKIMEECENRIHITILPLADVEYVKDKRDKRMEGET